MPQLSIGSSHMSTNHHRSPLERHQSNRRVHPRIAEKQLRVALHAVIVDGTAPSGQRTPAATAWRWHDLTRERCGALPCADERAMLADAIRSGCTTRGQVLTYFLARIGDAMAHFPDADTVRTSDILYVRAMAEIAEAQESIALAHTLPSAETRAIASREGREAHQLLELVCTTYERGDALQFPGAG
jgi:hypothetical protein